MVEDILRENPGMKETYRAYARKMYVERQIDDLRRKQKLTDADRELLTKYEVDLKLAEQEVVRCQQAEAVLRNKSEEALSAK